MDLMVSLYVELGGTLNIKAAFLIGGNCELPRDVSVGWQKEELGIVSQGCGSGPSHSPCFFSCNITFFE